MIRQRSGQTEPTPARLIKAAELLSAKKDPTGRRRTIGIRQACAMVGISTRAYYRARRRDQGIADARDKDPPLSPHDPHAVETPFRCPCGSMATLEAPPEGSGICFACYVRGLPRDG